MSDYEIGGRGVVARVEGGEVRVGFCWGVLREKGHLEDLGVDGRIITKWMSKKWNGEAWAGLIWLRIGRSKWRAFVNTSVRLQDP
jgi:hypothetical protein